MTAMSAAEAERIKEAAAPDVLVARVGAAESQALTADDLDEMAADMHALSTASDPLGPDAQHALHDVLARLMRAAPYPGIHQARVAAMTAVRYGGRSDVLALALYLADAADQQRQPRAAGLLTGGATHDEWVAAVADTLEAAVTYYADACASAPDHYGMSDPLETVQEITAPPARAALCAGIAAAMRAGGGVEEGATATAETSEAAPLTADDLDDLADDVQEFDADGLAAMARALYGAAPTAVVHRCRVAAVGAVAAKWGCPVGHFQGTLREAAGRQRQREAAAAGELTGDTALMADAAEVVEVLRAGLLALCEIEGQVGARDYAAGQPDLVWRAMALLDAATDAGANNTGLHDHIYEEMALPASFWQAEAEAARRAERVRAAMTAGIAEALRELRVPLAIAD